MKIEIRIPKHAFLFLARRISLTKTQIIDAVRCIFLARRFPHFANEEAEIVVQLLRVALKNLTLDRLKPPFRCASGSLGFRFQLDVLLHHPLRPGADAIRILQLHLHIVDGDLSQGRVGLRAGLGLDETRFLRGWRSARLGYERFCFDGQFAFDFRRAGTELVRVDWKETRLDDRNLSSVPSKYPSTKLKTNARISGQTPRGSKARPHLHPPQSNPTPRPTPRPHRRLEAEKQSASPSLALPEESEVQMRKQEIHLLAEQMLPYQLLFDKDMKHNSVNIKIKWMNKIERTERSLQLIILVGLKDIWDHNNSGTNYPISANGVLKPKEQASLTALTDTAQNIY